MKETHTYDTIPEPGFKDRMERAVQPYFIPNQNSSFTSLNGKQLINEHPDLLNNDKFLEKIFETSTSIYIGRTSEK